MISDLAFVHPEARLGKDVTVEPFAYIDRNVEIGDGTWIGPNATVLYGARIGKNCKIFPSSVVSGIPQDLKFKGEESTAEIGDNTTIREGVTVNRGTAAVGRTVVGSNCLLMAYSHIGHDSAVGNFCIIGNSSGLAGEVKVDDWAILSGGTLVHQFVHIGAHVMIGGGSRVRIDVPPYIKADREPLSYMGLNSVGLTRRGFEKERIDEIHNIYRVLFQSGLNNSQALEKIEQDFKPSEDRDYIIQFIRKSERGIIRSR
ncbi:MAG: acyl-[acyl-carrier-protein]--UDP-N-acetylglucosamine O-acyltransferase [Bacteroidetes bacterium GWE2_41_25]|nr:MAG: acyl-[acyl-carrier-protein]--UDP-N-acetylglucosamine O-acyltransferase [Bacteroidetes bacterium GWA2_40_15]OFX85150.1 MAG: acyl-[acyl-carrier-protein]--UDP-N-acetylglucosamine O-acyltransferase [Bacteroidetes bacterium GWC2_40_22]OFY00891.1 MAG: acyl-[acyl-carrier-protein]--UDP-N-acetylglucosamine O-acyltransferase [Bacteroidetes bacterium GWE2_41_25]OFY60850.1 MAG: acyl-[acyl-carrier-protein]--UDP-N-acetylglucosamine O-acyltransferase [Bacteroidetes bacterium GWF2_41_9]HAM08990.1 acyl-